MTTNQSTFAAFILSSVC